MEFAYAAMFTRQAEPLQYQTAANLAVGSDQMPRDLMVQSMYGSFYRIEHEDGTVWERTRDVAPNPQWMLDLVTDEVGSMLYRGGIGWIWISPGEVGQWLQYTDDGPRWVWAEPGSTNNPDWFVPGIITPSVGTNATLGTCAGTSMFIKSGSKFNTIQFPSAATVATTVVQPCVYDRVGNIPTNLLATGPAITGVAQGINDLPLDATLEATADDWLFIGMQIKTTTFNMPHTNGVMAGWSFPAAGAIPATAAAGTQGFSTINHRCWPALL